MQKNIEELKNEEIEELTQETDLRDLESLILQGTDARVPVVFDLKLYDKKNEKMITKTVKCFLKPLTNTEVQNAQRIAYKFRDTTPQIEFLKKGMFDGNDELFNGKLISSLPTGVVDKLAEKLLEISGVELDKEEQRRLAEDMMGF